MAKNMTRKGLALGASFALLSAGVTAMPASAAVGIDLDSNGTAGVFGAVEAQAFTLTSNGNAEFPVGNAGLLRVHIKNVSGSTASAFKINGVTLTDGTTADDDANGLKEESRQVLTTSGATASTLGTTAGDTAVMAVSTAADSGVSDMTSPFTFSFTSTAAEDAPGVYEVTVFADTNNNGVKDTGETASATRTVTFYDLADVTGTVTLSALTEGDTTVSGTMVFANLDMAQMDARDVGVWLEAGDGTKIGGDSDGTTVVDLVLEGATSTNGTAGVVEWDSTNKYFEFTTAALGTDVSGLEAALVKATYVKAHALHDSIGGATPAAADAVDTATSALVATRVAGEIKADTVTSVTAADATAGVAVTEDVALNSTYQVKATVKDTATTPAAVAGAAVTAKVTVDGATLSSTVTVAVNGTTHTAATTLPGATGVDKLALTTDANGDVFVTITTTGFANGNDVRVDFYTENLTAYIITNNETISWDGYVTNAIDGVSTTDGAAAIVNVSVRDQFGNKPADGKFRVVSDFVSSAQTTAATAASEGSTAVVNGEASLSILDNGTGAGKNVYDIDLATLAVDGSYASTASIIDNFEVHVLAATTVVGAVTVTDGANSVVTQDATTKVYTDALVTGDGNSGELLLADIFAHNPLNEVTSAPVVTSAVGAEITGNLTTLGTATAAAVAVPGAMVTLSGEGLLFNYTADGSKEIFAVGSITVPSDKSGAFTVTAWSNKAGKQTVTLTSNGASATLVLASFDAAAAGTGTSLVITAPDAVAPGSTLSVTATLTDKYGNPVATSGTNTAGDSGADFAYSYTGPGLMVGSAPTKFGTDGTAKLGYFLGSNDSGTITVVFQYDANGDNDFADTGDISVTKTIVIGTVGNTGALASWTKNLNDGTVKMYAKNIVGAGKVQFMVNGAEVAWVRAVDATDPKLRSANGSYYLVRTVELVEGQKNVLEIYVDGVRTTRTAYTY